MIHKLHFPQLPLSQFVENMWLVQGFEAGNTREKILPDGAIELIIDLDTQPKSIFEDEASAGFRTVERIQTRAEADGLRAAWAEALDQLKAVCEG